MLLIFCYYELKKLITYKNFIEWAQLALSRQRCFIACLHKQNVKAKI